MPRWRIGLVQMAPELGKVEKNFETLLRLTAHLNGTLDLLCLPEMILTGYSFDSAEAIKPFLEEPGLGATSRYCKELATRLGCHVVAGYPEKFVDSGEGSSPNGRSDHSSSTKGLVGYNSAILYGPDGLRGNYRKTNLFDTDKPWAIPGDGFATFEIGRPLGKVSVGICMDLNPFPPQIWTSMDGPYELAEYTLDQNTNLLIILCAWLDSKRDSDSRWDMSTLNYWIARLRPLWKKSEELPMKDSETIVVICNRSGREGETRFAGTSAVLRCSQGTENVEIVGLMTREQEGVRVWDIYL